MVERIKASLTKIVRRLKPVGARLGVVNSPMLLAVGGTIGFVAVLATQLQPPDPESRLPDQYRLAALIQRQQDQNNSQRQQVEDLRRQLEALRSDRLGQTDELREQRDQLTEAGVIAGLTPVRGTGFTVSLDDSSLEESPTGNINDLVIHSQDVQAVVNGLWSSGAEAIAINGQRLVGTSAVLCVGNTLLINGTVHAPPYEIQAVGSNRSEFSNDPLVREVREVADKYKLGYTVTREQSLEIPGYAGSVAVAYAQKKS